MAWGVQLAACCLAAAATGTDGSNKAASAAATGAGVLIVGHKPLRASKGRRKADTSTVSLTVFASGGAAVPENHGLGEDMLVSVPPGALGTVAALHNPSGVAALGVAEDKQQVDDGWSAGAKGELGWLSRRQSIGIPNPFDPFRNPFDPLLNPFVNNTKETTQPFVRVVRDWSHNDTAHFRVDIASPNVIVSVYLLMFVPIVMAWVAMYHYGSQDQHYALILPMTLCSMIIGQDLVNQSLSVLMESPTAITAIQALSMTVLTALWTGVSEAQTPELGVRSIMPLIKWWPVALMFTIYQLVNHLVSYYCSLSERTVFLNLCPIVSLAFEMTLLPRNIRATSTFSSRMALCSMVLGAVLFSLQYPNFTASGICAAIVLVLILIPYRVLQRWLLAECAELPVQLLALYDGIMLLVPSCTINAANQDQFWRTWETWFHSPSIALMLALSWMTFTGNHVCTLLMLRLGTATNYLVLHNLAGFIVVFEGIVFFGDRVVQAPLVFAGILISLCSGLWYAFEAQTRMPDRSLHGSKDAEESP